MIRIRKRKSRFFYVSLDNSFAFVVDMGNLNQEQLVNMRIAT